MDTPFKLLVYAIAFVALLWVFFNFMAPLFFRTNEPIAIIGKNLDVAETTLGKGVMETVIFEQSNFSGLTFDSDNRSVAFECNDETVCCYLGQSDENCSKQIVWGPRNIEIKEKIDVTITTRCLYENTLFVCKAYFGKEPAQVEIKRADLKETVDLEKENAIIGLSIANTGNVLLLGGEIVADVYERYLEGEQGSRRYIGKASDLVEFEQIEPDKTIDIQVELHNLPYAGLYEVELTVRGHNAGFEKKQLAFEATGNIGCKETGCSSPQLEFGNCKTVCSCEECRLSSECEKKVKNGIKQIMVNGNPVEVDLWEIHSTILGTNKIEISLPSADFCQ